MAYMSNEDFQYYYFIDPKCPLHGFMADAGIARCGEEGPAPKTTMPFLDVPPYARSEEVPRDVRSEEVPRDSWSEAVPGKARSEPQDVPSPERIGPEDVDSSVQSTGRVEVNHTEKACQNHETVTRWVAPHKESKGHRRALKTARPRRQISSVEHRRPRVPAPRAEKTQAAASFLGEVTPEGQVRPVLISPTNMDDEPPGGIETHPPISRVLRGMIENTADDTIDSRVLDVCYEIRPLSVYDQPCSSSGSAAGLAVLTPRTSPSVRSQRNVNDMDATGEILHHRHQHFEENTWHGRQTGSSVAAKKALPVDVDTNDEFPGYPSVDHRSLESDKSRSVLQSSIASNSFLVGGGSGMMAGPQEVERPICTVKPGDSPVLIDGKGCSEPPEDDKSVPPPLVLAKCNDKGEWRVVNPSTSDASGSDRNSYDGREDRTEGKRRRAQDGHRRQLAGHQKTSSYTCDMCGRVFREERNLLIHVVVHNSERPFACPLCRKTFKRKDHLTRHEGIHRGIKPNKCHECGRGFYRSENLRVHIQKSQSEVPLRCYFCEQSFHWKCALTEHLKDAHQADDNQGLDGYTFGE